MSLMTSGSIIAFSFRIWRGLGANLSWVWTRFPSKKRLY